MKWFALHAHVYCTNPKTFNFHYHEFDDSQTSGTLGKHLASPGDETISSHPQNVADSADAQDAYKSRTSLAWDNKPSVHRAAARTKSGRSPAGRRLVNLSSTGHRIP